MKTSSLRTRCGGADAVQGGRDWMSYRRISITIVLVALVGALLTTLMPLTSAASKDRSSGKAAASSQEGSGGGDSYIIVLNQEPTGGRGRDNGPGAAIREVVHELDQAHGL